MAWIFQETIQKLNLMTNNRIQEALQNGKYLYQNNRFAEAEAAFNKILRVYPNNINALHLLALTVFKLGRPLDAEYLLRTAIKRNKKNSALHYSLGQILEVQGKLDSALKSFKVALKLDPRNEWIHINSAIIYGKLDKTKEAISSCRAALRINHKNVSARTNLGQFLWRQGNNKAAIKMLEEALELQPDFAQALSHLGTILFSEGNLDLAEEYLRRAKSIGPPHPEVLGNLTGVLLAKDDNEALDYCREAIELSPNSPNAYLYLGRALELVSQWDEAFAAYSKALELQPVFKLASLGLANAKMNLGQFDEAKALCWQELKKDPNFLGAYTILLPLEEPDIIRDKLTFILQLYNKYDNTDKEKWDAAFSLAQFYEKDRQYEQSFHFLNYGNRLKRASFQYELASDRELFNAIKSVFTKDFIHERSNLGSPDNTPIFILGMPRSGTTLTEQILASHSQVFGAGELMYVKKALNDRCIPLPYEKFPEITATLEPEAYKEIANWYLSQVNERALKAPKVTDKMPHNFLHLGIIRILFPHAKIIHCRRDPIDNCLSLFKQNFRGRHNYAYNLTELGHYYLLYDDLMSHWGNVLPKDYLLDVQYEDMVADQEGITRKLLEFCDLPWDDNCLQFHKTERAVLTASQKQVRRKIYTDSIKLWQRYEEQLQPLIDVLQAGNVL